MSRENVREFFMRKKFISDDLELSNLAKKGKKNFGGSGCLAAASSQFYIVLHKSNCCKNFRAVTLLWAKIMHVLLLVLKSGTSASPLLVIKRN